MDLLVEFILLRLLVGFLGEKSQYSWWETDFLSVTGQQFLKIIFPRTALSAGIISVSEAARRLHDSRIGLRGNYHLFRAPEEEKIYQKLYELNASGKLLLPQSKEQALQELRNLSGKLTQEISEGPVRIGTTKKFFKIENLKLIAALYCKAFSENKRIFPYFLAT